MKDSENLYNKGEGEGKDCWYKKPADWTAVSMGPQWSLATLTDTEMPDKSK